MDIRVAVSFPKKENSNLFRVETDFELGRFNRLHLPMVYYFAEEAFRLTEEWQKYLMLANYKVEPKYIAAVFGHNKAYANGDNGFGGDTPRANWFTGEDLDADPPVLPKCWTGGDAIVEYKDGFVKLMDGILKPDIDTMPWNNPELWFACVTTGNDGKAHPFPNGATYPWYRNGLTPAIFLPHVRYGGSIPFPPPKSQWTENTARIVKI